MLRAIGSFLMSGVMVITLLWGGCIACPQFFMFPGAKKDCCKAGHCERSKSQKTTPGNACKRMPLEPSSSMHFYAELPLVDHSYAALIRPKIVYRPATDITFPVEHSPPDLQVLYATFLI